MPVRQIFLFIALGLSLGALGSYFYQQLPERHPASTNLLPPPKLRLKPWAHSLVGKLNQAISVKITAVGGVPDRENQELTLKAQVTLNRPIDGDLQFQWSLPADTSLVSGEIEDVWPNLKPGQTATAEISVIGVSKEDFSKTVTLHVSGTSNGVQYATAGSFAPNSSERIPESEAAGFVKVPNPDLVLKKSYSAEKMEQVHQ